MAVIVEAIKRAQGQEMNEIFLENTETKQIRAGVRAAGGGEGGAGGGAGGVPEGGAGQGRQGHHQRQAGRPPRATDLLQGDSEGKWQI